MTILTFTIGVVTIYALWYGVNILLDLAKEKTAKMKTVDAQSDIAFSVEAPATVNEFGEVYNGSSNVPNTLETDPLGIEEISDKGLDVNPDNLLTIMRKNQLIL